jgi:NAD(P)-dependent dehydrogenase (short-subunit alcohol dehydrogenase family)
VVAVDLSAEGAAASVSAVEAAGGTAIAVQADVTKSAEVEAYVKAAVDTYGGVDVFFNNAGIEGVIAGLEEYPEDVFDQVLDVNVKGVWLGMRYVADAMRARGGGAIVNTASGAGLQGTPSMIPYGASKHAVIGMTKTAGIELAPAGIRVNAVCPGPVETGMMERIEEGFVPGDGEEFKKGFNEVCPAGRYADAEEIAALAAFLLSDEAGYITASYHSIDGGLSATA